MNRQTELEQKIRRLHPNWSQDKARFLALQVVGRIAKRE